MGTGRLEAVQGPRSILRAALGTDWKGKISPLIYTAAIVLAWWSPPVSELLYVVVALLWLVPDRRIERALKSTERRSGT